MKRIGVFGGTFNPIHMAHLITAEEVCIQMSLDKILFIPAADHPFKDSSDIIDFDMRMKMINLAIKGNGKFESSGIENEISNGEKSFSVNTLIHLREQYKNDNVKLYLIIGMDNLIDLHKWKDPGKLFMLSEVVVFNKPNYFIQDVKNDYGSLVTYVPVKNIDITATDIRFRIKEDKPIKYLVTADVEKYILENKIYK